MKALLRLAAVRDTKQAGELTGDTDEKGQVRFREIVNTCTEKRAEKRIQRMA